MASGEQATPYTVYIHIIIIYIIYDVLYIIHEPANHAIFRVQFSSSPAVIFYNLYDVDVYNILKQHWHKQKLLSGFVF